MKMRRCHFAVHQMSPPTHQEPHELKYTRQAMAPFGVMEVNTTKDNDFVSNTSNQS